MEGAAHPWLWQDRLDPIGERRNETEVLAHMLLPDPKGDTPETEAPEIRLSGSPARDGPVSIPMPT
jgi:hypothetical protein